MRAIHALAALAIACTGTPNTERAPTPSAVETRATAADTAAPRALRVTWVGEGDGPVAVMLHGWGGDGADMVPLAHRLHLRAGGAIRFAVLEAPLERPGGGRAWWHLDLGRDRPADRGEQRPEGLIEARRDVLAFMSTADDGRPLDAAHTVVVGFSQGGMLAADLGLFAEPPLAGIAVLSGGPVDESSWQQRMNARRIAHVFISHGRFDPVLSFEASNRLADELTVSGSEVVRVPFDGGHEIPAVVVEALADDLRAVLLRQQQ